MRELLESCKCQFVAQLRIVAWSILLARTGCSLVNLAKRRDTCSGSRSRWGLCGGAKWKRRSVHPAQPPPTLATSTASVVGTARRGPMTFASDWVSTCLGGSKPCILQSSSCSSWRWSSWSWSPSRHRWYEQYLWLEAKSFEAVPFLFVQSLNPWMDFSLWLYPVLTPGWPILISFSHTSRFYTSLRLVIARFHFLRWINMFHHQKGPPGFHQLFAMPVWQKKPQRAASSLSVRAVRLSNSNLLPLVLNTPPFPPQILNMRSHV